MNTAAMAQEEARNREMRELKATIQRQAERLAQLEQQAAAGASAGPVGTAAKILELEERIAKLQAENESQQRVHQRTKEVGHTLLSR